MQIDAASVTWDPPPEFQTAPGVSSPPATPAAIPADQVQWSAALPTPDQVQWDGDPAPASEVPDIADPWYLKKITLPDSIDKDNWEKGVKEIEAQGDRIKKALINPKAPFGAMEVGAHLGTMTYGVPAVGFGHLVDLVTDGKYKVAEKVGERLIYEPQTESGEVIRDILFSPFLVAEKVGDDRATSLVDELAAKYGPDDIRTTLYPTIRKTLWDIIGIVVSGKGIHLPRAKAEATGVIDGQPPVLDTTFAKNDIQTKRALEQAAGGKNPLEILAKKEAALKGDIPIEGQRAGVQADVDQVFTRIPEQADIIRRQVKEHEGAPTILPDHPVTDPRLVTPPTETPAPVIDIPSVVSGRKVELPETAKQIEAAAKERPPIDPKQVQWAETVEANTAAFIRPKRFSFFDDRSHTSRVATLRGKIKELGGIHLPSLRDRVGRHGMADIPVSVKRMTSSDGIAWDLLQRRLQDEGWLAPGEDLVELLRDEKNLRRGRILVDPFENKLKQHMTDQERQFLKDLEWEPEAPPGLADQKPTAEEIAFDSLSDFFDKKRTAWDTAKDVNTVMGSKGEINLKGIEQSPARIAALNRLKGDITNIKAKADAAGKTLDEYLTALKLDPEMVALLAGSAEDIQRKAVSSKILPDKAVVGRVTLNKPLVKSDDFKAAKNGDGDAARRVVAAQWTPRKTELLKETLPPGKDPVFLTQPSSSRTNQIPITLACLIKEQMGKGKVLIGDAFFDVGHDFEVKNLSLNERIYKKRVYVPFDIEALKEKINHRPIVLVEDVLSSAGSLRDLARVLSDNDLPIESAAALMGENRLTVDLKSAEKLKTALTAYTDVDTANLNSHLTRTEAGRIIRQINQARTPNAREKLTRKLQGLSDSRSAAGLGRSEGRSTAKKSRAPGKDFGHEPAAARVQTGTGIPEQTLSKPAHRSIKEILKMSTPSWAARENCRWPAGN